MRNKQELEQKIKYFVSQGKLEYDATRLTEIKIALDVLMRKYHKLTGEHYDGNR